MEEKLQYPYRIPCYMFDRCEQLRPAAFMDMAQDLAVYGSEQLQFDDRQIKDHGIVWILARMSVRYDIYPRRYDTVTLQTWHRGLDGLFFIRDYQAIGPNGNVMVRGTSSWILMDLATRKVVRSDRLEGIIRTTPQCTEAAMPALSPKIVLPQGAVMTPTGEHRVVFSDVDYNGHANNAKYTSWAMDCLPLEYLWKKQPSDITVNFNHEAYPGETVSFMHFQNADTHFIEGLSDGHQVFICRMTFRDR